jgi:hypothetical protein
MQQTQTVNIHVVEVPGIPDTAASSNYYFNADFISSILITIVAALALMSLIFLIKYHRNIKKSHKTAAKTILALAILPVAGLVLQTAANHHVSANSALSLTNPTVDINVFKDDQNAAAGSTVIVTTVSTDNSAGYTLDANLDKAPTDDITIALNGNTLTDQPSTVHKTETSDSHSVHEHILDVTVPQDVQLGTYSFDIVYGLTENVAYLNNLVANHGITTMQAMTPNICQSAEYDSTNDGANDNNTATLTDVRNNQQYQIRKLIDGKCWMVTNLKIGSTTGPTVLTNQDTNLKVASFTLPQLYDGSDSSYMSYTDPYVFGPVTGDSSGDAGSAASNAAITNDTFYGYLYNWCAATAGDTNAISGQPGYSCTIMQWASELAQQDICPKGWRLPYSGRYLDPAEPNDFRDLHLKVVGVDNESDYRYTQFYTTYSAYYQPGAAFNGVFSGRWENGFTLSGSAEWWSSVPDQGATLGSYGHSTGLSGVYPYMFAPRNQGSAVRCML